MLKIQLCITGIGLNDILTFSAINRNFYHLGERALLYLYGRGRYNISSERVLNQNKCEEAAEKSNIICNHM